MPAKSNSSMEIIIRDPQIIAPNSSRNPQMSCIRPRQDRLVLLAAEKVDGMDGPILFCQMGEVALESWLGGMRACDLDTLAEGL